jgi:uncharacterized membrane protein
MNRPLRTYAYVAAAVLVIGILENAFFGADSGGARHYISVGFFFATVLALVALVVLAVIGLVRRSRTA